MVWLDGNITQYGNNSYHNFLCTDIRKLQNINMNDAYIKMMQRAAVIIAHNICKIAKTFSYLCYVLKIYLVLYRDHLQFQ